MTHEMQQRFDSQDQIRQIFSAVQLDDLKKNKYPLGFRKSDITRAFDLIQRTKLNNVDKDHKIAAIAAGEDSLLLDIPYFGPLHLEIVNYFLNKWASQLGY